MKDILPEQRFSYDSNKYVVLMSQLSIQVIGTFVIDAKLELGSYLSLPKV
jgi:hypothetical protein